MHTIYDYDHLADRFLPAEPFPFLAAALARAGKAKAEDAEDAVGLYQCLIDENAKSVQHYCSAEESLTIYRHPDGWLVSYEVDQEMVAFIQIRDAAAYFDFQTRRVAPITQKIQATNAHNDYLCDLFGDEEDEQLLAETKAASLQDFLMPAN